MPFELSGAVAATGALPTLLLALSLGLRHATDPDHLSALVTLAADPERGGPRATALLGAAWGLGHALTWLGLGLLALYAGAALPPTVRLCAELVVGIVIVAMAARLLLRWRQRRLHRHAHRHGPVAHSHPHLHERRAARQSGHAEVAHAHSHADHLGRSPGEAFGIGLVHGVGGSGVAVALLATAQGDGAHALALLLGFATTTALAMAGISAAVGLAFDRRLGAALLNRSTPLLGAATFTFGVWYAGAAVLRLAASS